MLAAPIKMMPKVGSCSQTTAPRGVPLGQVGGYVHPTLEQLRAERRLTYRPALPTAWSGSVGRFRVAGLSRIEKATALYADDARPPWRWRST